MSPEGTLIISSICLFYIGWGNAVDVQDQNATNIALFGKWSYEGVKCNDISLQDYIELKRRVFLPHSAGRYASRRFRKAKVLLF